MSTFSGDGQHHPEAARPASGPGTPVTEGVTLMRRQSGGADAVIAAVSAATLVPFIQALMSRAADSTFDWVRQHLRSGRQVRVSCRENQVLIVMAGGPDDAALADLAALDFGKLPEPCVLRWDAEHRTWRVTAS